MLGPARPSRVPEVVWIVAGSWALAGLLGVVILGFCGYELAWKGRRLARDLARLRDLGGELTHLQRRLSDTQQRAAQLTER
jgi:hypothetical protein